MLCWPPCHLAGVHLVVSNLLAPPQLQTDEEFTEASKRLYGFIAEHLGEHALLNQGQAHFPTGHPLRRELLVPQGEFQRPILEAHYLERTAQAHQMALEAGLVYAHDPHGGFTCHNCGGVLVWFSPVHCKMGNEEDCTFYKTYCDGCEWHEQHFTDDGRHCGHCGAAVPIKALTPAELTKAYADMAELAALGEAQFA